MDKRGISRTDAKSAIEHFFQRRDFSSSEVKKIKALAMKNKIKLKEYKRHFCRKCFSSLNGHLSISKTHKSIACKGCGYKNRFRI